MFGIAYVIFVFFLATAFAAVEIQIEGEHGWAQDLPCWRPKPGNRLARIFSFFNSGKPLTGYHLAANVVVLLIIHFPFFAGVSWSIEKELETISYLCLLVICEDFLWFVWNPSYGVKKFGPQYIWWHKKWTGPVPSDYDTAVAISFLINLGLARFSFNQYMINWLISIAILGFLVLASVLIASLKK